MNCTAVRVTVGILHPAHKQPRQPLVALIGPQLPLGRASPALFGMAMPAPVSLRQEPRSSQPTRSPLAKHSEHTVKYVLPVSKVTAQGKGAGGQQGEGCWISHRGGNARPQLAGPGTWTALLQQHRRDDGHSQRPVHPGEDSQAARDTQPRKSLSFQLSTSKCCCKSLKAETVCSPLDIPCSLGKADCPAQPRSAGLAQCLGGTLFPHKTWYIFFLHSPLHHSWGNSCSPCSTGVKRHKKTGWSPSHSQTQGTGAGTHGGAGSPAAS